VSQPASSLVTDDTIEVTPGYVDLQTNGVGAVDFWSAGPEEWRAAGSSLLATGVTSYLPTLPSGPLDAYDAALDRVAAARDDASSGALPRVVGVHLEGPFLGDAPGAHPRELLRAVDVDWLLARLARHPGLVRLVTLAPEADPNFDGIRALREHGVVVALGHSRCDYDVAAAAAEAGAQLVTHLFNGMGPRHHRSPGLADAALDPLVDLVPTLIADGVHVHPAVIRTLRDVDVILVTDAVATGTEYFGQHVTARDGAAYLDDGTLTGSTLSMEQAVRNVVEWGWPLERALDAASTRPARIAGLPRSGLDDPRADRLVLDPRTLGVQGVGLAGAHVYGS
jgi:N-acetylglucosamine-6-phosphate deacetylase